MAKEFTLGDDAAFKLWYATVDDLQRKQYPFAASQALNDTMFAGRKRVVKSYDSTFEGGLNYFRRGLSITKSNKNQTPIMATIQETTGYMMMQQRGFTKSSKSGKMAIPTKYARQKYGTKSGKIKKSGWPSRLLKRYRGVNTAAKLGGRGRRSSKKDPVFLMQTTSGKEYIVERIDRASRVPGGRQYAPGDLGFLYVYVDSATVRKAWNFDQIIIAAVRDGYSKAFAKRLAKAIKTAK